MSVCVAICVFMHTNCGTDDDDAAGDCHCSKLTDIIRPKSYILTNLVVEIVFDGCRRRERSVSKPIAATIAA